MRERLRQDAEITAPWIAGLQRIPTKALAFIVFHGGGSPLLENVRKDPKSLLSKGNGKILRGMVSQYGGRI